VGSTYGPHTGDIDFYAQWSPVLHNVTYEEYGGTTVPNATFVSGGTVTLPADPTRAGYTFDGWFTEETDGTRFNSTFSPADENVVVHAQWTQIPFLVTFEEHGGTAVPDSTFVSGGTLALPADPTRAGYTFNGWFTAQTGGTKYGSIASPPDGNLVVHAQWTAVPVLSAPSPAPSPAPSTSPTTTVPAAVSAAEVVAPVKEIVAVPVMVAFVDVANVHADAPVPATVHVPEPSARVRTLELEEDIVPMVTL
jgi:uncharacterized repeat protein (TIGR02543 family)